MIINRTKEQIFVYAEPGKFITDGEVICSTAIMPAFANVEEWREITQEEKERMEAELNDLYF